MVHLILVYKWPAICVQLLFASNYNYKIQFVPEWKVDRDGTFLGKCLVVDLIAGVILILLELLKKETFLVKTILFIQI